MTFNNIEEIKSYVMIHMKNSVKKAQEQVYQIVNRFVKEYYAEFSPSMYERTYQLYRSLVKSEIKDTGKGYTCEVYFDVSALDYAMKTVNGKTISNKSWSEEKILSTAAHGSHGGYINGTAIYDEPLRVLNSEGIEILRRMLISEGIPIR